MAIAIILLIISIIGIIISYCLNGVLCLWLSCGLFLFSFAGFLGIKRNGQWLGILIDERCKVSLSRFQGMLWKITICSAIATVLIERAYTEVDGVLLDIMAIDVPPEIWGLIGVSFGSTVTAIAIKSQRDNRRIPMNTSVSQASFPGDMIRGEELVDYESIDITKYQMLMLTFLVWGGYVIALSETLLSENLYATTFHFPDLSGGLLAIYGISQAGYLGAKAVPRSEVPIVQIEEIKRIGPVSAFQVTMKNNSSIVKYEIKVSKDNQTWESPSGVTGNASQGPFTFVLEAGHEYEYIQVVGIDMANNEHFSQVESLPKAQQIPVVE